MNTLFLIARIGGQRLALSADVVQSVVEIESITPVPLTPPHIRGLSALRSRTLTIVDSVVALGLEARPAAAEPIEAIVVTVDGHLYGLLVDRVDDVVTIATPARPIRARMDAGWARAALGMLDHDGDTVVLLDPAVLVAGPAALAA